jgi:type I restriction enzyme R subunit
MPTQYVAHDLPMVRSNIDYRGRHALIFHDCVPSSFSCILAAAGIKSPDISLRKLINDGIRSRSKANVVQTKAFSERLEDAVARYHANAITTAEVLQELIQLAKDIRAARQRGEESGLSDEEIAFYDALAENESAVQMMGDDKLKLIAHELLMSLRENVSVDWAHRDSARARMRVLVKRILRIAYIWSR